MKIGEIPQIGNRIVVTNGTPWKPGERQTAVGALGIIVHVSPYHAAGQFECWIIIDGQDSPTILWTGQFDTMPTKTNAFAVSRAMVDRWTTHLARTQ